MLGAAAVAVLRGVRRFDPQKTANFGARTARTDRPAGCASTGSAAPICAPPSRRRRDEEIEAILTKVWDNLGRFGGEFAHLDRVWDYDADHPERGRIELPDATIAMFDKLIKDGKGALIFAAHLGNWELPALAAPAYGLDVRGAVSPAEHRRRRPRRAGHPRRQHGRDDRDLARRAGAARERAASAACMSACWSTSITRSGVDVTFFGRTTKANPLLARLARQVECPIHGVAHRPPAKATAFAPRSPTRSHRCATHTGAIDVQGTTQKITSIIEGWIREHPEQWLWLHRRWR